MTEAPYSEDGEYEITREFRIARADAIQAYSYFEGSLCALFSHLAGVTDQIGGIIFFKMVNARSRIATLERLKRLKYGSARNLYFNSIMAATTPLDGERNKIVHWHEVVDSAGYFGQPSVRVLLHAPNFWDATPESPVLDIAAMNEFANKCLTFSHATKALTADWTGRPWLSSPDIFEQPVKHPLPEDHPLIRFLRALEDQPPPSPESP
jgi:hypothetical protein